jgi:hypothetical protein
MKLPQTAPTVGSEESRGGLAGRALVAGRVVGQRRDVARGEAGPVERTLDQREAGEHREEVKTHDLGLLRSC